MVLKAWSYAVGCMAHVPAGEGRNAVHCVHLAYRVCVVHCAAPLSSEWLHMRAEGRVSLCRHKLTAPDCACRSDGTARNTNFPQWLFMDVLRSPPPRDELHRATCRDSMQHTTDTMPRGFMRHKQCSETRNKRQHRVHNTTYQHTAKPPLALVQHATPCHTRAKSRRPAARQ